MVLLAVRRLRARPASRSPALLRVLVLTGDLAGVLAGVLAGTVLAGSVPGIPATPAAAEETGAVPGVRPSAWPAARPSAWPAARPSAWPAARSAAPPAVISGVRSGAWPLSPRPQVVTGFDPPLSRWSPGHRGVDLAGRPAQAVRAAGAGRVLFAGRIAGRGVVVVGHGTSRTTYEPVSAQVRVGDRVTAGAAIGWLELFGSHCFPRWCLHWGLIEGRDHYLDPLTLVAAAPVRLLPVLSGKQRHASWSLPGWGPGYDRAPDGSEP